MIMHDCVWSNVNAFWNYHQLSCDVQPALQQYEILRAEKKEAIDSEFKSDQIVSKFANKITLFCKFSIKFSSCHTRKLNTQGREHEANIIDNNSLFLQCFVYKAEIGQLLQRCLLSFVSILPNSYDDKTKSEFG